MREIVMSWRTILLLLSPVILYALALNPYLAPEVYDNVLYWEGSRSLAAEGTYAFFGKPIVDWPPLLSIVLAWGSTSVVGAKGIILIGVAVGLLLAYYLLVIEGWQYPLVAVLFLGVNGCAFACGTKIMTEWVFLPISYLFLIMMHYLEGERRSWWLVILAGGVLAAALLTRYAGISLVGAVGCWGIWQLVFCCLWRWTKVIPEVVVAIVGVVLFFLLWGWHVVWLRSIGQVESTYYQNVAQKVSVSVSDTAAIVGDIFYKYPSFSSLNFVVVALVVLGCVLHVKRRGARISDFYVAVSLVLLFFLNGKTTRYLIPILPFVFLYLVEGVRFVASRVKVPGRVLQVLLAVFMLFHFAVDVTLLVRGNGRHGGMFWGISRTERDFYQGYWRDLYDISTLLRNRQGKIGLLGTQDGKYISYFSRLPADSFDADDPSEFIIVADSWSGSVPEGYLLMEEGAVFRLFFRE